MLFEKKRKVRTGCSREEAQIGFVGGFCWPLRVRACGVHAEYVVPVGAFQSLAKAIKNGRCSLPNNTREGKAMALVLGLGYIATSIIIQASVHTGLHPPKIMSQCPFRFTFDRWDGAFLCFATRPIYFGVTAGTAYACVFRADLTSKYTVSYFLLY